MTHDPVAAWGSTGDAAASHLWSGLDQRDWLAGIAQKSKDPM